MARKPTGLLKDYLTFTRSEKRGIIALVCILAMLIILPYLTPLFKENRKTDFTAFMEQVRAIQQNDTSGKYEARAWRNKERIAETPEPEAELFPFNPNNLPDEQWKQLGLSEKADTLDQEI
jgi:competence protein ComEA